MSGSLTFKIRYGYAAMYKRRIYKPIQLPKAVDLQELGAEVRIYGEVEGNMKQFNPSIAWHDGELFISIRSCNFGVERHGKWYLRDGSAYSKTDVLIGRIYPDSLNLTLLDKLELSEDTPLVTKLAGLEDVRLFSRKDGLHAIGFESDRITRSLHNKSATLAEYIVKGNELKYLRTLEKPDFEVVEKNWQPTDEPTKAFDFTYSPTQVWRGGDVEGDKYEGNIHGGSQLLKQKDGTYLSLVHEKLLDPKLANAYNRASNIYDKYIYYTYLAKHDKNGIVTQLSKPFRFGTHENIEFASGMVEHEGNMIISLGIRDCKYAIVKISKEKLMGLFEEVE